MLVEPVVIEPIRQKWDETRANAAADDRQTRERLENFIEWLGDLKILDPACGSGNFLYVVLAGLHQVQLDVFSLGGSKRGQRAKTSCSP